MTESTRDGRRGAQVRDRWPSAEFMDRAEPSVSGNETVKEKKMGICQGGSDRKSLGYPVSPEPQSLRGPALPWGEATLDADSDSCM